MSTRPLAPTPRTYAQLRDAVIAVAVKGPNAYVETLIAPTTK